MSAYPEPDTYGHTSPATEPPPACHLCTPVQAGWLVIRREDPERGRTEALQPCPGCAPVTFARWQAGHLGCHRSGCEVCAQIDGTALDAPATGGARWLD